MHLSRLEALVHGWHGELTWSRVQLVDEVDPQRTTTLKSPREDLDRFADTWARLVKSGCFSWINLHAVGVDGDTLVVAVEHHPLTTGRIPPDRTSVKLSGPEKSFFSPEGRVPVADGAPGPRRCWCRHSRG